jgi:oxygen-independent coproporphyrinogen-3 oxidase
MTAGVYLHIPFCRSRCSYCDFATDIYRSTEVVERYIGALCREIENSTGIVNNVDTVYFGGGTPSLLSPEQLNGVLETVRKVFRVDGSAEITMEMNPGTVSPATLHSYRAAGVNRASFGLQTFDDIDLRRLARGHDSADAVATFRTLRQAGYTNVSFDLIAGLPGQSVAAWKRNLERALELEPEHLSLYLLEIHEGTPLAEQIRSGRQSTPDDDVVAEMYELMVELVTAAGYVQYEISNFARPGFESRHNAKYWLMEPVYGFGASAHSFDGRERFASERDSRKYVELIENRGNAEVFREKTDVRAEAAILGLRMTQGMDLTDFRARFGTDLISAFGHEFDRFIEGGLIEVSDRRLRLTSRGMLFSNEVFTQLV